MIKSDVFKCLKLKIAGSSTGGRVVGAKEYQTGNPGLIPPVVIFLRFFLYTSQKYSKFVEYADRCQ